MDEKVLLDKDIVQSAVKVFNKNILVLAEDKIEVCSFVTKDHLSFVENTVILLREGDYYSVVVLGGEAFFNSALESHCDEKIQKKFKKSLKSYKSLPDEIAEGFDNFKEKKVITFPDEEPYVEPPPPSPREPFIPARQLAQTFYQHPTEDWSYVLCKFYIIIITFFGFFFDYEI